MMPSFTPMMPKSSFSDTRHERATANPFYIDLEDEEPPDPSELIERMQSQAEEGRERGERQGRGMGAV